MLLCTTGCILGLSKEECVSLFNIRAGLAVNDDFKVVAYVSDLLIEGSSWLSFSNYNKIPQVFTSKLGHYLAAQKFFENHRKEQLQSDKDRANKLRKEELEYWNTLLNFLLSHTFLRCESPTAEHASSPCACERLVQYGARV
jgi:hypothetical protein